MSSSVAEYDIELLVICRSEFASGYPCEQVQSRLVKVVQEILFDALPARKVSSISMRYVCN